MNNLKEKCQFEQMGDVPEAGLNHQRVPAETASTREPVQSSTDHKERARQQDQSRDEVIW